MNMSSALKPALPQGAGGQNNQSGSSPKSLMGGSQPNHGSHGHMSQIIPQTGHHPQNMSNNIHLPQSVAQNMTMAAHNNQNVTQLGNSVSSPDDYSISQGNKNTNSSGALSLVQDKSTISNQPLALTRTPEKSEIENGSLPQSNGTSESPKTDEPGTQEDQKELAVLISGDSQSLPSIEASQSSAETSAESSSDSLISASETKPNDLSATSNNLVQGNTEVSETSKEPLETPAMPENDHTEEIQRSEDAALPLSEPEVVPEKTAPEKIETEVVAAAVENVENSNVTVSSDEEEKSEQPQVNHDSVEITDSAPEEQVKDEQVKEQVPDDQTAESSKPETVEAENVAADTPTEASSSAEASIPDKPSSPAELSAPVEENKSTEPSSLTESSTHSADENREIKNDDIKPDAVKELEPSDENSTKEEDKSQPTEVASPPPIRQVYSLKTTDTKPKPTLKLATVPPNLARKRRSDAKPPKSPTEGPSPAKKPATPRKSTAEAQTSSTPIESRISKRNRTQVQPYQSPTPELAIATKLSATHGRSTPTKQNDEKLIVFYKNEYLAVRNAEGGFYVCQAVQNVYRNTARKIKIRWLSQNKEIDPSGETYTPDFYDTTDMECVLTTLSLTRAPKGSGAQRLSPQEEARAKSILDRAIEAEKSGVRPEVNDLSEEHPDGLDLSLYKDESQLDKKKEVREAKKRSHSKSESAAEGEGEGEGEGSDGADGEEEESETESTPNKKARQTPAKKKAAAPKKGKAATSKVVKAAVATAASAPKAKKASERTSAVAAVVVAPSAAKGARPSVSNPPRSPATPAPAPPSKTATATIVSPSPAKMPKKTKVTAAKTNAKSETPKAKTPKTAKKTAATTPKSIPIQPMPSTSTGKATRTPRKPPSKK